MADCVGTIMAWPTESPPDGWLPCDGRTLKVSDYQDLFSVIGHAFGKGSSETFLLPDLRGRMPIGSGQREANSKTPSYSLGTPYGKTFHSVSSSTQCHIHELRSSLCAEIQASQSEGTTDQPSPDVYLATAVAGHPQVKPLIYTHGPPSVTLAGGAVQGSLTSEEVGGGLDFDARPAYTVLNYIICAEGDCPLREEGKGTGQAAGAAGGSA